MKKRAIFDEYHCKFLSILLKRSIRFFIYRFSFRRILNNYLIWQTVRSLTACLSKPFREAYKGLRKALLGSEGHEEQWRYCVSDVNNAMGFAIGAMFVREVFHGKSKPMVSLHISLSKKYLTTIISLDRLFVVQVKMDNNSLPFEDRAYYVLGNRGFSNMPMNPILIFKYRSYYLNNSQMRLFIYRIIFWFLSLLLGGRND